MGLLKRFAYYFGGLVIGTIFLFFILDKKDASCDYSPNARVLKNISTKNQEINPEVLEILALRKIDTAFISNTLQKGDVLFRESNTQLDSCNIYVIQGVDEWKNWKLSIENCKDIARIIDVEQVEK
ncbi:MAG TPA: hypothetical protein VK050_11470 [Flavobacteriaceae bacterium]|nr:hypothetical protein [Flavobacteriaceae bacterium]